MQTLSVRVQNGVYEEHILNASTILQPYGDLTPAKEWNLTYEFHPDCQNAALPSHCDPKPINITIPRQHYDNVLGSLRFILPSANATTARQAGLWGAGRTNPGGAI
ncbi:hypothetical protein ACJQWK_01062 [Exserohilum turcicum]|uniref:Uncharacterized protein n=1 Tax=Exserohilum turcicum (strain 28A) TaxID=671987 RepID=R0IFJ6_EXST2|nr:uncharacterized protein SETTUDRAFT_21372 [Exserohilum turcica Et28A]EOA84035.1 hypothetical protein SETTUDRAFT_21372 [Exserohilum turcica Et28A]